jgi:hypothetical protein
MIYCWQQMLKFGGSEEHPRELKAVSPHTDKIKRNPAISDFQKTTANI